MSEPLRKCRVCGLEAHNEQELELFYKNKTCSYGRQNVCKKCGAKKSKQYRHDNYLKRRLIEIKQRCYNPNAPKYPIYGGRGIVVCDEWLNDPDAFEKWALANGFKKNLQIDRIDNDGLYSPDNCRWATRLQQARNKSNKTTDLENKTRICEICKIKKPFSAYHKNKADEGGFQRICKECISKRDKKTKKV